VIVGGLDISLNGTGVARLDTETGRARVRRLNPGSRVGHDRLEFVVREVTEDLQGCDIVGVEGYAYNSRTPVAEIHELSGLLKHQLWRRKIPYALIPPSNLKAYTTGNGNAQKVDMLREMQRTFPALILGSDDEADALALAAMVCAWKKQWVDAHRLRYPHEFEKCAWPNQAGEPRIIRKPRKKRPRFD
jgi:crossover junction endodeoxyribonuclease RuvC